jgi:SNF2 family DNA or RNA helicase
MSTQIFKRNIPNELLFNILDELCVKNDKYYIFNVDSFRKGVYKELISKFLETCKPYYHISKRKYLEKKLTFNSFITVLRQICNFNKITYTSQIKYDKSDYSIIYYIYFSNTF